MKATTVKNTVIHYFSDSELGRVAVSRTGRTLLHHERHVAKRTSPFDL